MPEGAPPPSPAEKMDDSGAASGVSVLALVAVFVELGAALGALVAGLATAGAESSLMEINRARKFPCDREEIDRVGPHVWCVSGVFVVIEVVCFWKWGAGWCLVPWRGGGVWGLANPSQPTQQNQHQKRFPEDKIIVIGPGTGGRL